MDKIKKHDMPHISLSPDEKLPRFKIKIKSERKIERKE